MTESADWSPIRYCTPKFASNDSSPKGLMDRPVKISRTPNTFLVNPYLQNSPRIVLQIWLLYYAVRLKTIGVYTADSFDGYYCLALPLTGDSKLVTQQTIMPFFSLLSQWPQDLQEFQHLWLKSRNVKTSKGLKLRLSIIASSFISRILEQQLGFLLGWASIYPTSRQPG